MDKFKDNSEIKIGHIFTINVGWSMIIPKFYKVVNKRGSKTVILQECEKTIISGDSMQGKCICVGTIKENAKPFTARISKYGLKIDGHYASLYDGQERTFDYWD